MKDKLRSKLKAFTVIELVLVIIVIGILFVVLITRVDNVNEKTKVTGVQNDFRSFYTAVKKVGLENQLYTVPNDQIEYLLNHNLDKQMQFTDGVCNKKDPWGEPYTYATRKDVTKQMFYIVFASKGGRNVIELPVDELAKADSDEMNVFMAMKQVGTQFYGGITSFDKADNDLEITEVSIFNSLRDEAFEKWSGATGSGGSDSGSEGGNGNEGDSGGSGSGNEGENGSGNEGGSGGSGPGNEGGNGSGNEGGTQEPEAPQGYKVILNYNDGQLNELVTVFSVSELPTPTQENYKFLGWYTDAINGELATDEFIQEGNVTLYAHWEFMESKMVEVTVWKSFTGADYSLGFDAMVEKEILTFDSSKEIKPVENGVNCVIYEITKPSFAFISFVSLNCEQKPGGAIPMPYSLNYEICMGKWLDSGKPSFTKGGGDIEYATLTITQEDIDDAGGVYTLKVGARAAMYPSVLINDLGQFVHLAYGVYELD